jgi:hypothetical protein
MLTKEYIQKKIAEYEQGKAESMNNFYANEGGIQAMKQLLAEMDKPEVGDTKDGLDR